MEQGAERKAYYEKAFEAYTENEWNQAPGKQVLIDALRSMYTDGQLAENERGLDLACGTGFLLSRIRQEVCPSWQLTGVDFSEKAVERGRNLYPAITFACEDGSATNLAAGSFSIVVSYGSIEHFKSPKAGIAEVARLLEPGGRFLIMVPALGHYRVDRTDEGWYEDLTGQPQWNFTRPTWESYFESAALELGPLEEPTRFGALIAQNFFFGRKPAG